MAEENTGTQNSENTGEQQPSPTVVTGTTPANASQTTVNSSDTTNAQSGTRTNNESDQKIDVDDIVRRAVAEAVQTDRDQRNENKAKAAGFNSFKEMTDYALERKRELDEATPELKRITTERDTLRSEVSELRSTLLEMTLKTELVEFLSKKYPHYMGRQDWIMPKLRDEVKSGDNTDLARRSAIESVVKSFVSDNPLSPKQTEGGEEKKTETTQSQGSGAGPQRSSTGAPSPIKKLAEAEGKSYIHNAMRSGLYPRVRTG